MASAGITALLKKMDYKVINWTYLISQYLINKLSNKVCVIDLDLHHGNGTQKMLEGDDNTLFLDFHYYDGIFYPRTGNEMDDTLAFVIFCI